MLDPDALLDRAPDWVRRAVSALAAGRGPLGRLADAWRFRPRAADIPKLPPPARAATRLAIGPANSAGQGYQWARAAERHLPDTASFALRGLGSDVFAPPVDLRVPVAVYQRSKAWHSALEEFLAAHTHVVWESGLPLLGRRYSSVAAEIAALQARGVRAALMFHGSDIRPPARHAEVSEWSPFAAASGLSRSLAEGAAQNAELTATTGLPVFVSTPDLLRWMPEATWCPVIVEPEAWQLDSPRSTGKLVVAHAPSSPWLKGTDLIEPVLRRLDEEGVIEYRQIVGVPHARMPAFYASADVVLDQFVLGIYGVAACEAMAAGRLVMSHVDAFTREEVRHRTGLELPVHEVTPDSLEAELRQLAAAPRSLDHVRRRGPEFVREVHDGRRSAEALRPFLEVRG